MEPAPSTSPAAAPDQARVPDWVLQLGTLDLSRLAEEIAGLAMRNPVQALGLWDAVQAHVPVPLRTTLSRLLVARLDLAHEAVLLRCPGGHDFLFHRRLEARRPVLPPPRPYFTPGLAFDTYAGILLQQGSTAARRALLRQELVLLALRRESSTLSNKGRGSYDDQVVVLNGHRLRRSFTVFMACTEPGAQYSARAAPLAGTPGARKDDRYGAVIYKHAEGRDMDGDGIRDAGRLQAGSYEYFEKPGGFLGDRAFRVQLTQQAERDTDGDGRFTEQDPSRIDATGAGTTMYIHRGGAVAGESSNTWSAGCQTIPANQYPDFLRAIGRPRSFFYVLVNTALP